MAATADFLKANRRRLAGPPAGIALPLKLEAVFAEKARAKQQEAGGAVPQKSAEAPIENQRLSEGAGKKGSPKSANLSVDTREEVAKAAGVSGGDATPEQKENRSCRPPCPTRSEPKERTRKAGLQQYRVVLTI
jgi:hypothetical protein